METEKFKGMGLDEKGDDQAEMTEHPQTNRPTNQTTIITYKSTIPTPCCLMNSFLHAPPPKNFSKVPIY